MNQFLKKDWASLLVVIAGFVVITYFYNKLPETIPTHFNLKGEADGWGNKSIFLSVFPITMIIVNLLTFFIYKLDPKRKFESPYDKPLPQLRLLLNVLFVGIFGIVIYSAINGQMNSKMLLILLSSILFIGLGNLMHSVKHNYFIGFRTPWTLENEVVWVKTHRLVAKIWVSVGLINVLIVWFVSAEMMMGIFVGTVVTGVLWPFAYSWYEYKKQISVSKL